MKICILANTLSTGGFTSSLLPMLSSLSKNNIQVDLMLFEKNDYVATQDIAANIIYNNTALPKPNKFKKLVRLLFCPLTIIYYILSKIGFTSAFRSRAYIRFAQRFVLFNLNDYSEKCDLSDYDCVVSWEEGFCAYFLAKIVIAKRKITFIHPDYKKAGFDKKIDFSIFQIFDKIVSISSSTAASFCATFPTLKHKSAFVPNVLDVQKILENATKPDVVFEKSNFDIVTVCRLDNRSKAILRAVEIADILKKSDIDFKWYIIGEGLDRTKIEKSIAQSGLQNTVILLGQKNNPHPYTKKADLFCLQSYYEGKPLSVEEAMVIGTPCLVTNYTSAQEQIADNVTGFIAENNTISIFKKLKYIVENPLVLKTVKDNVSQLDTTKYTDSSAFVQLLNN